MERLKKRPNSERSGDFRHLNLLKRQRSTRRSSVCVHIYIGPIYRTYIMYMHILMYEYMFACLYVDELYVGMHACIYLCIHVQFCTYIYKYISIIMYVYACTYVCTVVRLFVCRQVNAL